MLKVSLFLLLIVSAHGYAADADHTAVVTRLEGEVRILSPRTGKGKTARVQGKDYDFQLAREGDKVGKEHTLQSLKGGRARLVFPNGDQMTLGENSLLKLSIILNKKKDKPVMDLMFGKVRAVIQQGGPRADSEVRTSTMVMGVRGTDFFVEGNGVGGQSTLTVLRGEVAVSLTALPQAKEVTVSAGHSLEAPPASVQSAPPEVKPVARKELLEIQRHSVVARKSDAPTEVVQLEQKALEAAKADLMKYDPEAAKTLTDVKDADEVSTHEVKKNLQRTNKPGEDDLKLEQDDVYRKYFKD